MFRIYGLSINFLLYVFNFYFLVLSLKLIGKHQQTIREAFSELQYKTLTWLRVLTNLLLITNTVWVIEDLVLIPKESPGYAWYTVSIILTFIMINWVGWKGLRQPGIFSYPAGMFEAQKSKDALLSQEAVNVTETMRLTRKEENIYTKLLHLIEEEKMYCQLELNLQQLAEKLDVKETTLTKIIKVKTDSNFHSFINHYRVEEFKRLLNTDDRRKLSIRDIAYKAGFKSKSTFYTAFKKFEGTTPLVYLQNQDSFGDYALSKGVTMT